MRGRLINPFLAEIARLDSGTAADPDFRETARREMLPIRVPCQVEVGAFEALQQLASGNSPDSRLTLVFHFRDLERLDLVDPATGTARIRVNDRLVAIHDLAGRLVQAIRTPPGLYATEVQPQSFGFGGRNLLLVLFQDRELGTRGAA